MMNHIFQQGSNPNAPILLMLHGTGGDEHSLMPLAAMIDPEASVLSVRGNILENGMPRFFKRLSEGVFDEEDLIFRTKELKQFIDEVAEQYGFDRGKVVAIGYSNGANIAASLLFHYSDVLLGAILHHPMVPLRNIELPQLNGVSCFISAGENDMMCHPAETEELAALLTSVGGDVMLHWERNGHQLTRTEIEAAREWYNERYQL